VTEPERGSREQATGAEPVYEPHVAVTVSFSQLHEPWAGAAFAEPAARVPTVAAVSADTARARRMNDTESS
jgi:hypothetical protein